MSKKILKKDFYEKKVNTAKKWLIGGIAVTAITYMFPIGNYYILAFGPVLWGLVEYIGSKYNYKKYEDSNESIVLEEEKTPAEKTKSVLREFAIIFAAFLVLNSFVVASFEVPTGSMENEIMTGDFLLVNKFVYGGTTPRTIPFTNTKIPSFKLPALWDVERGDVIVFIFPGYREEVEASEFAYYLKRAVAVSGDTLEIINRIIYVNGKPQSAPRYIKFDSQIIRPQGFSDPRIFPKGSGFNEDNYGPIVIPKKDDVITLNLSNIQEWDTFIKREGHTVTVNSGSILIDGKQQNTYTVQRDYVFGMGDHRDNSLDSRFWGFIPKENVIGTPLIVYWSWDPMVSLFDIGNKLKTVRWNRFGTLVD